MVIKDFECTLDTYSGDIVNRTDKPLKTVTIAVKSFDNDGDPIGGCVKTKTIGANSGDRIYFRHCNCRNAKSVVITIR